MVFPTDVKQSLDMINPRIVQRFMLVGGQPSESDFDYLKGLGINKVINLRPTTEVIEFNQCDLMRKLNIDYHLIAISNGNDLTKNTIKELVNTLPTNGELCLFHCASGNRVGALLALKAYWFDGCNAEQAIQLGLDSGLSKLLPVVKKIISSTTS